MYNNYNNLQRDFNLKIVNDTFYSMRYDTVAVVLNATRNTSTSDKPKQKVVKR